jgi:heptosyltransferase I
LSHLTAALDRPNITLFGPTDPGLIGGYGKNQHELKAKDNNLVSLLAQDVFVKLEILLTSREDSRQV